MNVTQKQAEFWVTLLGLMIIVAVAVLFLDFGIKTAILDESIRLRLLIEGEQRGRQSTQTNTSRVANDSDNNPPLPADVLVDDSTGMETGNDRNGDSPTTKRPNNSAVGRSKPRGQARARTIPPRDKQV